jgi:hypothetical protein
MNATQASAKKVIKIRTHPLPWESGFLFLHCLHALILPFLPGHVTPLGKAHIGAAAEPRSSATHVRAPADWACAARGHLCPHVEQDRRVLRWVCVCAVLRVGLEVWVCGFYGGVLTSAALLLAFQLVVQPTRCQAGTRGI